MSSDNKENFYKGAIRDIRSSNPNDTNPNDTNPNDTLKKAFEESLATRKMEIEKTKTDNSTSPRAINIEFIVSIKALFAKHSEELKKVDSPEVIEMKTIMTDFLIAFSKKHDLQDFKPSSNQVQYDPSKIIEILDAIEPQDYQSGKLVWVTAPEDYVGANDEDDDFFPEMYDRAQNPPSPS